MSQVIELNVRMAFPFIIRDLGKAPQTGTLLHLLPLADKASYPAPSPVTKNRARSATQP